MGIVSNGVFWAILGIVLVIAELMTMSFVLIFFGLGALLTAFLSWAGIAAGIKAQLIVFSISSLAMLFMLRTFAKNRFFKKTEISQEFVGEKVKVTRAIPANGEGSVYYRGSEWIAISDSAETIPNGSIVEITGTEGIRVRVKKIS